MPRVPDHSAKAADVACETADFCGAINIVSENLAIDIFEELVP